MNTQTKKICLFLATLSLANLLSGCDLVNSAVDNASSSLWPISQFSKVCNQEPAEQGGAYDGAAGKVHKIALFGRTSAEENYRFIDTPRLSGEWTASNVGGDDPASVELVVCFTRIREEFVDACEYEDVEDANIIYTINLYNASYDVKVFAATTGEELSSETIEVTTNSELCPEDYTFQEGYDSVTYYAGEQGEGMEEFLKPYIEP